MWTVGLARSGNELGLDLAEADALQRERPDEYAARIDAARKKLAAGETLPTSVAHSRINWRYSLSHAGVPCLTVLMCTITSQLFLRAPATDEVTVSPPATSSRVHLSSRSRSWRPFRHRFSCGPAACDRGDRAGDGPREHAIGINHGSGGGDVGPEPADTPEAPRPQASWCSRVCLKLQELTRVGRVRNSARGVDCAAISDISAQGRQRLPKASYARVDDRNHLRMPAVARTANCHGHFPLTATTRSRTCRCRDLFNMHTS